MSGRFADAMRRATDLVRTGDPHAATAAIREGLGSTDPVKARTPRAPLGQVLSHLRQVRARPDTPRHGDTMGMERRRFTCAAGSRDYLLHVPPGLAGPPEALVLMLHGCTQTPADFARGTAMNDGADGRRVVVAWPAQTTAENAQGCWNWFRPGDQHRGSGEPAILAGLAQALRDEFGVARGSVFVAGLSAGGAMAAILGQEYGDVFSGIGVHSGLPAGAASGLPDALAAMRSGRAGALRGAARPVRTIVFHGGSDRTVTPVCGDQVAADACPPGLRRTTATRTIGGRTARITTDTLPGGGAAVEHWRIEGAGHQWSGGDPSGSHTDAAGPDASAEFLRFFLDHDRAAG